MFFSELIPSPRAVHDDEDNFPFVDYDEYDAQVFKLPTPSLGWDFYQQCYIYFDSVYFSVFQIGIKMI